MKLELQKLLVTAAFFGIHNHAGLCFLIILTACASLVDCKMYTPRDRQYQHTYIYRFYLNKVHSLFNLPNTCTSDSI